MQVCHINGAHLIRKWCLALQEESKLLGVTPVGREVWKLDVYNYQIKNREVLCIPKGYVIGLKANELDSFLIVFSNKVLAETVNDSWRFDKEYVG